VRPLLAGAAISASKREASFPDAFISLATIAYFAAHSAFDRLNTAEQFLVRVHNGEDPSVDEFREQVPDLGLPWWQLVGFHGWHLV
jgi:hypothetical protein